MSNYCPTCLKCLDGSAFPDAEWSGRENQRKPVINQVELHIGMGTDPIGLISYCKSKNITLQAYSPLGAGKGELITGGLVTGSGKNPGKDRQTLLLESDAYSAEPQAPMGSWFLLEEVAAGGEAGAYGIRGACREPGRKS